MYILKSLDIQNVKFIEIGTQDYSESNTRFIFETYSCDGLIIDPTLDLKKKIEKFLKLWKNNLIIHNYYIDADNIISVLEKYNFINNIDLFSIDIDGIDYWVIKSLPNKFSKIFIAEYNPYFGPDLEITVPNEKKYDRFKKHYSGLVYGASLKAIIKLLNSKGYVFVGVNDLKNNAFFVLKEFANDLSIELPKTDNLDDYTNAKFRNSLNKSKELDYLPIEKIRDLVKSFELVDVKDK